MRWLVAAIILAGCATPAQVQAPDAGQALYAGQGAPEGRPDDEAAGESYDCDGLTAPETWYGHVSGNLWCVPDPGYAGGSGTVVVPATPVYPGTAMRDMYQGWNGSVGHDAGRPIDAHVLLLCWGGPCWAWVTATVLANGTEVARLEKQEVFVDVILLGGVWIDLEGELSQAVPRGAKLSFDVEVSGVGPLMLRGTAGSDAPWFRLG